MKRRDLVRGVVAAGGVFVGAGVVNGLTRGFRFPIVQFEPEPRPHRLRLFDPDIDIVMEQGYLQAASRRGDGLAIEARAFAPEPALHIATASPVSLEILIRNLSPAAAIDPATPGRVVEESATRVNRALRLDLPAGTHRVAYRVPFAESFRFAAIGDSGGGSELRWCLERSRKLGADFVLHAGDFYYSDADFRSLAGILDHAPVPVFASIGNHDFHDYGRYIHRDFTREVGPRNWFFDLGDTVFVNFDTAASTWPVSAGARSALFDALDKYSGSDRHWVIMTHRPLHDPRPGIDSDDAHTLSTREVGWVAERVKRLTPKPVLITGHIHSSEEQEYDGITTYVSGDGLASRNLASGRKIARILIGEKTAGARVTYSWQGLEMPDSAYCHIKNRETLLLMNKPLPPGSFGGACPK